MGPKSSLLESPAGSSNLTRARTGLLSIVLLCSGHFFVDLYSSSLGVFQPLLVSKLGLSLTQAGWLGGVYILSNSVMQPVYGYLSDRFRSILFTALAPGVAGLFISALGLAPAYAWTLLLVTLGGAGIASFHPQASSRVTEGLKTNRGRWMAVFVSSGTLGFALGPTFFSLILTQFGLERAAWAALPGLCMTALLVRYLPSMPAPAGRAAHRFDLAPLKRVWKPLLVLFLVVFVRSIVQVVFAQLLPLYLSRERGYSLPAAAHTLSLYLAAGAVGGFLGGHLADRWGGRRVMLISMAGSVPFLVLFMLTTGVWSIAGLVVGGLILLFTIPVNVVMAQELVPSQSGTVSALMMGFAWGSAGFIFVPLTGWASDIFTIHRVLTALVFFPLVGFLLTFLLEEDRR